MNDSNEKKLRPPQHQNKQPGEQSKMDPQPISIDPDYKGSDKLLNKVAIITGGDSGIGRGISLVYAMEGADIVITYLNEEQDAQETKALVESMGRKCLILAGDIGESSFCQQVVDKTISELKKIDILINNSAEQHPQDGIEDITEEQLKRTFQTNIFSYFFMTKAALKHMKKGSCIINTASITAYKGNKDLIDYSSTKGAVVSFTRSLSASLLEKGIRVNGVAPGPIWTPLIPSSYDAEKVAVFGTEVPMKRAGNPNEVASCYVFLASDGASFMTGQMMHPNGGEIING